MKLDISLPNSDTRSQPFLLYLVFDPYAQARPVGRCAECGAALYDGDRVYYGRGTDHVLGCGQCIDAGFAREEQGGSHA